MKLQSIRRFFDKLEDKVRGRLSHIPIVYAIIGGAAHVLFWRGVWHLADDYGLSSWGSIIIGTLVLLGTGLIVASFIGDSIIISGIKHGKKVTEKTEKEVMEGEYTLQNVHLHVINLEDQIKELKELVVALKGGQSNVDSKN